MNLSELMTSDFIEGYSPYELREFLVEFRKNYRILHNENLQLTRELYNKDQKLKELEDSVSEVQKRNEILFNHLNRRGKLSWRERISGKINGINYES